MYIKEEKEILIVDDMPKNLQVLANLLSEEEYQITMATSGESALESVKDSIPDLILLDINMKGISGFETCKILKDDERYKDIPVIFLTARDEPDDIVKGFELGGVDYLTKPFYQAELLVRIKNILELFDLRKRLEQVAITDPLTTLMNRRGMIERLEQDISRLKRNSSKACLIISDIDNFKSINDTLGHDFGDYVLKCVAEILSNSLRREDLISRWGGEEFLIFLSDTTLENGYAIIDTIRESIATNNFELNGAKKQVTMTFGLTTIDENQTIDQNVKKADEFLYRGKTSGKNIVIY